MRSGHDRLPRLPTSRRGAGLVFAALLLATGLAPTRADATSDIANQPIIGCTAWSANRIDCFAAGTNGAMYQRYWNGSAWGGWTNLGGIITSPPSCVSWGPNRIDCFARGGDNAMYHRYWNGSAWGGWDNLGGVITSQPSCVSWGRSEEHTSELQSRFGISYAVFCLKKKKK